MFNFKLIMLLDEEYEPDEETRINKAFRHVGEDANDIERFDEYVRGGVEVLHEKLIEGISESDEYINRLFDYLEEFDERFNEGITPDVLLKLCSNQ